MDSATEETGLTCPGCGERNASTFVKCGRCRAPLDGRKPAWEEAQQRKAQELAASVVHHDGWAKDARKRHAITGAITMLILLTLFGLPTSLYPVTMLTNLAASLVMGLPAGWLISRQQGGMFRGAMTGWGLFTVMGFVMLWLSSESGTPISAIAGASIVFGLCGLLPGGIIGMSVEMDH